MRKYQLLWEYIGSQPGETLNLSFAQIAQISGVPIDHSFLTYKKELLAYGWEVKKISRKLETVLFARTGKRVL